MSWTQVTPSGGHFSGRNGHQSFLGEGGRLWVIGGYGGSYKNDIWYSDDNGTNWNQVSVANTPFPAREGHQAFLGDNGRLWVIGGYDDSNMNDIWYSDDEAMTWTQVTVSGTQFSPRSGHQAFLGNDNRLWVIGGSFDGNNIFFNDIWYSDNNGTNWNQVSVANTHFSARHGHQAFLGENGRLWVMGGNDGSLKNDIWYSD